MSARLRALLPAVAATLGTAAVLGALVTGTLALVAAGDGLRGPGALLRSWALFSALCAPLGFVFGVPLLAVARSVRRSRDRGAGEVTTSGS